VKGTGAVQFRYVYNRENNDWGFQKIDFDGSSLKNSREAVALVCMQSAARGSTFPVEPEEAARDLRRW
jgi:hypothetical protein